jgi:hypothetical protein
MLAAFLLEVDPDRETSSGSPRGRGTRKPGSAALLFARGSDPMKRPIHEIDERKR